MATSSYGTLRASLVYVVKQQQQGGGGDSAAILRAHLTSIATRPLCSDKTSHLVCT